MYSLIGVGALVVSVLVASHWFRAVNRVALPRNRGGHLLILALVFCDIYIMFHLVLVFSLDYGM